MIEPKIYRRLTWSMYGSYARFLQMQKDGWKLEDIDGVGPMAWCTTLWSKPFPTDL